MDFKENKKREILIFLICVLIMIPIAVISFYDRPAADDYEYALITHAAIENNGTLPEVIKAAWDTVVRFYKTWQGTYTSAFVMALQPGIWGARDYALAPFIVLGISYLFLLIATHIFNRHFMKQSFVYSCTVSLVFFTVLILWMPYPQEGLFWYNGAMHYTPWFFAVILNIGLLLEAGMCMHSRSGKIAFGASIPVSFLLSGVNQSSAFCNILCILVIAFYWIPKKRYFSFIPLLAACVGFVIMFVAPGNAVRQSAYVRQGVLDTIWATFVYVLPLFSKWFSFEWFLSLILATPVIIEFAVKNKLVFSKWMLLISLGISFAIICGMLCVPYMAMGFFGPYRLTNIIWLTFMFFSWLNYGLFWCYLVSHKIVNTEKICANRNYSIHICLLTIVCLAALFLLPNTSKKSTSLIAFQELQQGIPQQHAEEMDWRVTVYYDDSQEEAVLYPITVTSQLISHDDVDGDPNAYPNVSVGQYYGKPVYISPDFIG